MSHTQTPPFADDRIGVDVIKDRSGVTVYVLQPGRIVVCDDCDKDYTDSSEPGGLLFQSKALGPCCADKWLASAQKHGETQFIRGRCPAEKSFADWVREDVR